MLGNKMTFNIYLVLISIGSLITEWVTESSSNKVYSNRHTMTTANSLDHVAIDVREPLDNWRQRV
jgi:hypothetical protein